MAKRSYGDGGIQERGNSFRLRYRVNGKRHATTFHGTLAEAKTELRRLIHSGDDGTHIDPSRMTVAQWIEHWLSIGAPNRRRKPLAVARWNVTSSSFACM